MRLPIARSSAGILARLSWRSARPSARSSSGVRPAAALRSRAVAATAARSSSLKTRSSSPVLLFVACLLGIVRCSFVESSGWRAWRSGAGRPGRLEDPDRVPERIAEAHVGAVEVVRGLLREVGHTAGLEGLEEPDRVVRLQDQAAHGALRDELSQRRARCLVLDRRARLLERDLEALL